MESIPESGDRDLAPIEIVDDPPFVSALAGETEADNSNHVIARVALINRLVADPDVVRLIDRWMAETQLGRAATEAARCWDQADRLAVRMGFASWDEIEAQVDPTERTFSLQVESDADAAAFQREVDVVIDDFNRVAGELEAGLAELRDAKVIDRIWAEGTAFVRKHWAHSWPWMPWMLAEYWADSVVAVVCRVRHIRTYWLASPWEQPAPHFENRPRETLDDALERMVREAIADRPKLQKGRRTAPKVIESYVEWWYRRNIRGESINKIARDVAAERGREGDHRKHVRHGIGRAQHWLDVTNWVWRDDDD